MAAKSDGVMKMKKSDVAFTPLQNSELSGSVQGLHPGGPAGDAGPSGAPRRYSLWDCLWVVAAVAVYAADVGTDAWLCADYYLHEDYWWFGLTLVFVLLGSCSVQLFSFRWFVHDFGAGGSAVDCSHVDGKTMSGSASHGDVTAQQPPTAPATPQRQAATNSTGGRSPHRCCCVWFWGAVIHVLQLGQIWR